MTLLETAFFVYGSGVVLASIGCYGLDTLHTLEHRGSTVKSLWCGVRWPILLVQGATAFAKRGFY